MKQQTVDLILGRVRTVGGAVAYGAATLGLALSGHVTELVQTGKAETWSDLASLGNATVLLPVVAAVVLALLGRSPLDVPRRTPK